MTKKENFTGEQGQLTIEGKTVGLPPVHGMREIDDLPPVTLEDVLADDPQDTLIAQSAKIMAQLKVAMLVQEFRKKCIDRARVKFEITHEFLFAFQPRSHSGKFEKNEDGSFKLTEDGKRIPITKLDTRQQMNPETKKMETVPVYVNVTRYRGWDYGKKYKSGDLRALRKKQTDAAIGDQTHYADGSPILRPTQQVAHV